METDRDGIGGDAENDPGLRLAEAVPRQQPEQFLIIRSQASKSLQCRRLAPGPYHGLLRLGAEPEPETEPTGRASVLIGDDPSGYGEEPRQCGIGLGQAVHPAPGHCK